MLSIDILEAVIAAKKSHLKGDYDTAYKEWCRIYDLCEDEHHSILFTAMSLFTDTEVYDITDYGKKINGYA